MNFLAHAYLSGDDAELMIGNFVADSIKGKTLSDYPQRIREGVALHRAIDNFTDNHPVVRDSIETLRPVFSKFSGVVLDIYFDHFLARNWNQWSERDLTEYVSWVYKILVRRYLILPSRSKRILPFMMAQNWLVGYANFTDLERVFRGMTRRSNFYSGMELAVIFLIENHDRLEVSFNEYFPDLKQFSNNYISQLNLEVR
ncbi:MAG: DUF479 domain-containing protein [Bacteroidales bacterium]|nr:DUF479 domain-containing protein [Bacteroidales bacterium]